MIILAIIQAVLLTFFGLLMLFRPTVIWKITESWKSNDDTEPSDLYILSTRIGGVMFTLVGLGALIGFLFL